MRKIRDVLRRDAGLSFRQISIFTKWTRKRPAPNRFYVQSRFLAAKTWRWRQTGRLYRVLGRFDTQGRAFTA
ncbi:hypothetical protein ACK37A_19795 [Aeromonas veronii]